MKKSTRKTKFYLNATLTAITAISLITPFVIQSTNEKQQGITIDGYNLITPSGFSTSVKNDERIVKNQSFFDSTQAVYNNSVEPYSAGRAMTNSKLQATHPNRFTMRFGKKNGTNATTPDSIFIIGTDNALNNIPENGNRINEIVLPAGTGMANAAGTSRVPGVLQAYIMPQSQLNGRIWLLMQGWYNNKFTNMVYTALYTRNASAEWLITNTYTQVHDFAANTTLYPPVFSPAYKINANGDIVPDNDDIVIWQQNVGYNDLKLRVASITSGGIIVKEPENIGAIQGNPQTLSTMILKKGNNNYQKFIYHVNSSNTGISMSSVANSINQTIILNDSINLVGMDVANQMPYPKAFRAANGHELVWVFPKSNNSKIFSTTISSDASSISENATSVWDLGYSDPKKNRDVVGIDYANLGTIANNNAHLALRLSPDREKSANNGLTSVPSMINIGALKKNASKNEIVNDIYLLSHQFDQNNEMWISNFNNDVIEFSAYFNNAYYIHSRSLNNPSKIPFETVVPKQVTQNRGNSVPFDETTSRATLENLIADATKNAVSLNTSLVEIVDSVFYDDEVNGKWFDVAFKFRNGEYDANNKYLNISNVIYDNVDPNKIDPLPAVPIGSSPFRRIALFQQPDNINYFKLNGQLDFDSFNTPTMAPSQFLPNLARMSDLEKIESDFTYDGQIHNKLIGRTNDGSFIEISPAYLGYLTNVVVVSEDFFGTLEFRLTFAQPNSDQTTTLNLTYNNFLPIDIIVYGSSAGLVALVALVLVIIFVVLKRRKKKELTKALNAGFSLSRKLGDRQTSIIENQKRQDSIRKPNSVSPKRMVNQPINSSQANPQQRRSMNHAQPIQKVKAKPIPTNPTWPKGPSFPQK